MPADSIPAAHLASTEMSAHPVSKSSFKKKVHDPTSIRKWPHIQAWHNSAGTGHVRDGSATEVTTLHGNVRFAPQQKTSGHAC